MPPIKTIPKCPQCEKEMMNVGTRRPEGEKPRAIFRCLRDECPEKGIFFRDGTRI